MRSDACAQKHLAYTNTARPIDRGPSHHRRWLFSRLAEPFGIVDLQRFDQGLAQMIEQGWVVEGDVARADARCELAAQGVAVAWVAEEGGEARALGVGLWAGEGELAPDLGEDVDRDAGLEAMIAAERGGQLALEVVDGRVEELEGVGFAGRHFRAAFQ